MAISSQERASQQQLRDEQRLSQLEAQINNPRLSAFRSRFEQEAKEIRTRLPQPNVSAAQAELEIERKKREELERSVQLRQQQMEQERQDTSRITENLPRVTLEQLGGAEEQAQRAQLARQLMSQQQAAQRQLAQAQARAGVRGGGAAAQQARLAQQLEAERAKQEEAGFLTRRQFNIQQAQREQFANVATELARRNLMASLRGAQLQSEAAKEFGKQQIAAAGAGSGGCCVILMVVHGGLTNSVSAAEANDIVVLSKQNPSELLEKYSENSTVLKSVNELNQCRYIRDNFCNVKELRGYYKFSEFLVPKIESHPMLIKITKKVIFNPILKVSNGGLLGRAWIKFWGLLGSDKPFIRKNGEVV